MITKEELYNFLLTHRDYCKEKVFKKYFENFYIQLSNITYPNDFKFSQKLYHFFPRAGNVDI